MSKPEDAVTPEIVPTVDEALGALTDEEKEAVKRDREEMKEFISGLGAREIRSGDWFPKLVANALGTYTREVDWQYFQDKYKGVPADAIVDQRIKMASRFAALEGGLTAGAYTGAVVATFGTAGLAAPVTLTAAATTIAVDLAFLTRLQLRLAHDIAVLYRVHLDPDDPEDMWKLIRVAFSIKSGEVAAEGLLKATPAVVRVVVKRYYSRGVITAARSLPVVGKFLLQRNVIKIGIPAVGVPLAIALNFYTTIIAGRHARSVFRNEARVIEIAQKMSRSSNNPQAMLWVTWLVILADGKRSDDEALLMRNLVTFAHDHHAITDQGLADLIDIEAQDVWNLLDAIDGDKTDLIDAADRAATIDGPANKRELAIIEEVRLRCV